MTSTPERPVRRRATRPRTRPAAAPALPGALSGIAARLPRIARIELPDPKLAAAARRIERTFDLAMEKVIAHEEHPDRYPLPASAASIERRLLGVVRELPRRARRELTRELMPRVEESAAVRRRRLGDLAAVDLRSSAPILDRVQRLPVPRSIRLTRAEAERVERTLVERVAAARRAAPRGGTVEFNRLRARVARVECIRTTAELNRDEIAVQAMAVDALGNVTEVAPIEVGRFRRGDVMEFPQPDRLPVFEFDTTQGEGFPRAFAVTFLLVEQDSKLARVVRGVLFAIGLVLQVGAVVAAAAASPPAAAVLVGAVALGGILQQPVYLQGIFGGANTPHETAVVLQSLTDGLSDQDDDFANSRPETATLSPLQGGQYRLTTDYRLFAV